MLIFSIVFKYIFLLLPVFESEMRDLTRASTRMTHIVSNTHHVSDYCMRNSDIFFKKLHKIDILHNRF